MNINIKKALFLISYFLLLFPIFGNDEEIALSTRKDGKINRWITAEISKDWKKYDFNRNGIPDETFLYKSDKGIVYLIISEKIDFNGIGKPNIFIKVRIDGKDVFRDIEIDTNGDGNIDIYVHEKNNIMYKQENDQNHDGKIDKIEEFNNKGVKIKESTGKLIPTESNITNFNEQILSQLPKNEQDIVLSFYTKNENKYILNNLNKSNMVTLENILEKLGYNDGKFHSFYYYSEIGVIQKEEHDTNNDGNIDLWVDYNYEVFDNALKNIVIKRDNNYDGKPDEWHYANNRRQVTRVEKSTNFDGKIDYVKDYIKK